MQITYRRPEEYIPVDLEKLRPARSYEKLIDRRSAPVDVLIEKYGYIPQEFLSERSCPNCAFNQTQHEMEKDHLHLVRCKRCNLVFVNPIFDEVHYHQIYSSETYQEIVRDLGEASHEYRMSRFGVERVSIMRRYLSSEIPSPTYLDVGCSTGFVVEAAAKVGWRATGVDLNPSAVEFGKRRGLDLSLCSLFEAGFESEYFNVISLFEVLEHLPDPKKILEHTLSLLKPGGIIFIYVPNYDSASRILLGKDAHFLWPTHHLTYYTIETISYLLHSFNLKIEMVMTEGLDIFDYLYFVRNQSSHAETGLLQEIADKLQFFINAGSYGKTLRILAVKH